MTKSARAKVQAENKAAKQLKRRRQEAKAKQAGYVPLLEEEEKEDNGSATKKRRCRTDQNKFNKMIRDNLIDYGSKHDELMHLQSKPLLHIQLLLIGLWFSRLSCARQRPFCVE